jgi:sugar phosphate isomerase/epimerase
MKTRDRRPLGYSRREFGKLALIAGPAAWAAANLPLAALEQINSKIKGVQIGAITYSFRSIPDPNDIIKAYVSIGLGEMELMSGDAEKLAGAPAAARGGGGGRGAAPTPEQIAARDAAAKARLDWRSSASEATFRPVRKKIEDAGIDLRVLCYNMSNRANNATKDDEIEYAFNMAKWLGVKAMSTSTQVSMAKRLAPFAEKYKMMVGFHGHDSVDQADEVHNEASFKAVMAAGKYLGANLDVGHYTAAGGDSVAFIKQYHDRITNLHFKDMIRNKSNSYVPFGKGDAPLKEVLLLMSQEKWDIPVNIEFEYGGDPLVEIPKCLQFCRDALA